MTRASRFALVALASCISVPGCGESAPKPIAQFNAPHGGSLFDLPDRKGSVEILVVRVAKDAPGGSRKATHQVEAYFYQPDGASPLSPQPTDVAISLGDSEKIPLASNDQPGKAGRFASAPGPYSDEFRCLLSAKVGGQPIEISIIKK